VSEKLERTREREELRQRINEREECEVRYFFGHLTGFKYSVV
jgi:hypothetical protein